MAHPISATTVAEQGVARVPIHALVDVSSELRIEVRPAEIALADTSSSLLNVGALRMRTDRMTAALDQVTKFLASRSRVLNAYQAYEEAVATQGGSKREALARFEVERQDFDRVSADVAEALMASFPDPAEEEALNDVLDFRGDLRPASAFIESAILATNRRIEEVNTRVRDQNSGLRLEAWIQPQRGGAVTSLHLENYDNLDRGEVVRIDAAGLDLSAVDREAMLGLVRSTDQLSQSLGRYRRGVSDYRQLLSETMPRLSGRVTELVGRAESLRVQLSESALEQRARQWQADARTLADQIASEVGATAKLHLDAAQVDGQSAFRALLTDQRGLVAGVELVSRLKALGHPGSTPDAVAQLVLDLKPSVVALPGVKAIARTVRDHGGELVVQLDSALTTLPEEVRSKILQRWQSSAARQDILSLAKLSADALELVADTEALLGAIGPVGPSNPRLETSVLDVSLAEAPDTYIELKRTRRYSGDHVFLRATLLEDGRSVQQAKLGFTLQAVGWSARLLPAVAVAVPYRPAAGRESGQWATTLSWLWGYGAREGTGALIGLNAVLQPEFGLHAAFTGFHDDAKRDLGLGLTLSLWRGHIEVGYGRDLFARSPRHGGAYGFVGTDLVSILQRLGWSPASGESTEGSQGSPD